MNPITAHPRLAETATDAGGGPAVHRGDLGPTPLRLYSGALSAEM